MKKSIPGIVFIFSIFLLIQSTGWAQSLAPQSVSNAAGTLVQNNGSLSFTVGELLVIPLSDQTGNSIGGAFTAGTSSSPVSVDHPEAIQINVFPNPASELITVQVNHSNLSEFFLVITDLLGKEIYREKYAGFAHNFGLNTASYPSGTYFLSVQNIGHQSLASYKIIKH